MEQVCREVGAVRERQTQRDGEVERDREAGSGMCWDTCSGKGTPRRGARGSASGRQTGKASWQRGDARGEH